MTRSTIVLFVALTSAAAAACSKAESPTAPSSVGAIELTASQAVGVQAATPFTFSVRTTDFEAGSLTYSWEFGDGATSTDPSPTHVYSSAGTYTVVVTASNGRQSARSQMSVTVYSLTGRWVSTGGLFAMELSQSGSDIGGLASVAFRPGDAPYASQCALSGSVQRGTPAVIILSQPQCPHAQGGQPLGALEYRLNMLIDGQTLSGTVEIPGVRTDPIALRR